ncbi:MAG TPA: hypothetical protein VKB52_10205 [Rhodanobacteraceae bacterium]|nr:hypothetical protein [Rhodanobacteraceae bacterium]
MISIAALLLAAATSQTQPNDGIFKDGMDSGASCPDTISSPHGPLNYRSTSDILYLPNGVRHNVDVSEFDNIFGHIDALDDLTDWPGVPGTSPTIKTIGRNEYVGAAFHVPFTAPSSLYGRLKHVIYSGGPHIDASISRTCGDFEPVDPYCLALNSANDDQVFLTWRVSAEMFHACTIEPDGDYFLNIRFTNPNENSPDCAANACETTIQQYLGG